MKYSIKQSEINDIISEALIELDGGKTTLNEELVNKSDVKQIAKQQIKSFLKTTNRGNFEKEITKIIKDEIKKDKDLEKYFVEIVRDVIINLYRQFWTKRQVWSSNLKRN